MSFNFSLGSTQPQAQSTGFGGGFSQPAAGLSTFGQPAAGSNTSAFGTSFGQAAPAFGQQSGTSAFGGGFGGGTATSQAPATGSFSFGQPTATSASTFGAGFGTATTSAPATGFSFGQPQTSTAGTTGTGFGGFGSFAGGFGTNTSAATSANTSFSFGQPATSLSGFGTSTAPTTSTGTGFSFGNTFQPGASTSALPSFSAFGTNTGFGQPLFGQTQQQQQQQQFQQGQPQIDENQALQQSIFQVCRFGDERDSILAKLNYLQACWGCGKGYYSQAFPPVTYTPSNPFYRFKAVGYAYIFTDNNEDGNIVLVIKRPQSKVEAEESNILNSLQMMAGRPHIMFKITGMKATSEDVTQVVFHAEDKNTLRRIPATDMASFFAQPHLKPQLDNIAVEKIFPKVRPSPEQLQKYLENAPEGIDPRVWRKAQEDNPDPSIMIPVPMLGLDALKNRIEWQKSETKQHHERMNLISDELNKLQQRHSNVNAEISQLRRKHAELSHRVLSVICRQEMTRKHGMTIQTEEEQLKEQLEKIDEDFNSPTQFKGRLNELLSQIRLRKSENDVRGSIPRYSIDSASLVHIKEFLSMQQESLNHLVETTRNDVDAVKAIRNSACEMMASKKLSI